MRKYKILLLNLLAVSCLMSSCKKGFLDEELKSEYTPVNALKDSVAFEAAIAGLQALVRDQYTRTDAQGLLCVMQVGTDVAIGVPQNSEGSEIPYYNYTILNSQDRAAKWYWDRAYEVINNANLIIQYIDEPINSNMTEANRNHIKAEAMFYRAHTYNFLSTMYGDVPLIEQSVSAPKTDFTRTPVATVLERIISDLTFATTHLNEVTSVNKPGRINRAAAKHLLAEVYLRAGKPALAELQCLEIINSGKFSLTTARYGIKKDQPGDPFSDMFVYGNQRRYQGNNEALWVIEQEASIPGGSTNADQHRRIWVAAYYQNSDMKVADSLGGRGVARMRLSNWVLYQLYQPGDIRNSPYNLRREFYYNNPKSAKYKQKVVPQPKDTLFVFAPYTTKWNSYIATDEFGYGAIKDHIMMRLGETYLLLAESQFRQEKLGDAAATINVIRSRANASPVDAADITLDFILDERARELLAEENRRQTLVRTGKLVERATKLNSVSITGIQSFHEKMPIPQAEIDLNRNAELKQNPGYN